MGKTNEYKALNLKSNDFSFCVELPIKAKFNKFNYLAYHLMKDQELLE